MGNYDTSDSATIIFVATLRSSFCSLPDSYRVSICEVSVAIEFAYAHEECPGTERSHFYCIGESLSGKNNTNQIVDNKRYKEKTASCRRIKLSPIFELPASLNLMLRPIIAILITLLLTSCKSRSQNKIDIPKSLNLFKDGCEIMRQGFTTEFDDSLAGQKYYRQAIDIFNTSLKADPTNLRLGTYLSDLYYKEQKFDSALLWAQRLFPLDSVEYFKDNKISISNSYSFIGSCFLYEGDIQNGNKFFRMALDTDTTQVLRLTQALSDIADKFYYETLPNQIKKLKNKNIDACKYSLDIMELGLSIGGTEKFVKDFLFKKEKFTEREKTCK